MQIVSPKILKKVGKIEIERYLLAFNFSPCLEMGITLEVFNQSEKKSYFREKLNNSVDRANKTSAATFKN